jgi:hypothetical protein
VARSRAPEFTVHVYNIGRLHLDERASLYGEAEMILRVSKPQKVRGFENAIKNGVLSEFFDADDVVVECVSKDGTCRQKLQVAPLMNLDLAGGTIMPSPIAANSALGLVEISQEAEMAAGAPTMGSWDEPIVTGGFSVIDGLSMGVEEGTLFIGEGGYSKLLELATRAGVHVAVAVPKAKSGQVIMGRSALVRTGSSASTDPVIKENVALHIQFGKNVEGGVFNAIHGQFSYFRQVLWKAMDEMTGQVNETISSKMHNYFVDVLRGKLPLAVHVHAAEQILAFLRLKAEIESELRKRQGNGAHAAHIECFIVGGTEAGLVAAQLKNANIRGVILEPFQCTPEPIDSKRCRSLSSLGHPVLSGLVHEQHDQPLAPPTTVASLIEARVKVAISEEDDNDIQNLVFDAGWANWLAKRRVDGSMLSVNQNVSDPVGLITWNIADILGLDASGDQNKKAMPNVGRIAVGQPGASFVAYQGNPFRSYEARIALSVSASQFATLKQSGTIDRARVSCWPRQL